VVVAGKHGGTQKQAAFACKRCGLFTHLTPNMLPKGMFESLPDRKGQMLRVARRYAKGNVAGSGVGWNKGPTARARLQASLASVARMGAYCAIADHNGTPEEITVDLSGLDLDAALELLDQAGCRVLSCVHLDGAGRQKAVVFHETSGFAEL
jgi:hypothetical protein